MIPLRSRDEVVARLELSAAQRVLVVEAPPELEALLTAGASADQQIRFIEARAIRTVKDDTFDLILLWQESRVGSRSLFDAALKRLDPGGRLWVVTALRKVMGPRTAAVHRLEAGDLRKAFVEKAGMREDREARLSAWHVAYGFSGLTPRKGKISP